MAQRRFIRPRGPGSLMRTRLCAMIILLVALLGTIPRSATAAPIVVASIPVPGDIFGIGVNATTNRIYVSGLSNRTVYVLDGVTNTVLTSVTMGRDPTGLAVNEATNRIYVAN